MQPMTTVAAPRQARRAVRGLHVHNALRACPEALLWCGTFVLILRENI